MAQVRYRQKLVGIEVWDIKPGSHILEIGCGQGDCTVVLAHAVGPSGSVVAIDPAPGDYGAPTTLAESQASILASPAGKNIRFLQADAKSFLSSTDYSEVKKLDVAVLCHSLWYFLTAESVGEMFETLALAGIPRVYLAEWHLELPDGPRAVRMAPHYYAALAQRRLHELCPQGETGQNVRSALRRDEIVKLATEAGWEIGRQGVLEMDDDMEDGRWEVNWVSSGDFDDALENAANQAEREALRQAVRHQVKHGAEQLKAKGNYVTCMDSIWLTLER